MLKLDRLVLSATRLAAGAETVEGALGVPMADGGRHTAMGAHNRLLGLGGLYLEVITCDPDAPAGSWIFSAAICTGRWPCPPMDACPSTGPSRR